MPLEYQPLRIPAGWLVEYNAALYEVDPDPATITVPPSEWWCIFKTTMLRMRHVHKNRLLDLGWYPEGDLVNGHYGLAIHEGNNDGPQLHYFTTRDRLALVAEIERVLELITERRVWP